MSNNLESKECNSDNSEFNSGCNETYYKLKSRFITFIVTVFSVSKTAQISNQFYLKSSQY